MKPGFARWTSAPLDGPRGTLGNLTRMIGPWRLGAMVRQLFVSYRPEKRYMRGPAVDRG